MSKKAVSPEPQVGPYLRVLTDRQAQAIHSASLQVLERTGYHVPVAEARELLQAAGARVVGERVYVTERMVTETLTTLRPVAIFNRCGEPALPLGNGRVNFGALADTVFVSDPYQPSSRPYRQADQKWFATLLDALPQIDYIQCVGQSADVPASLQTQVAVAESIRHTAKPLWVLPYDRTGLLDVLDVLEIVVGGRSTRRDHPCLMAVSVPAAPLYGTRENIEVLLTCAETETPLVTYSCPALGGNSPCSVAGALVLSNADWLFSILLHQLKRPGAPVCSAGFTVQVMDMRSTLWSYCAPEVFQAYAAVTDLAHWYGMPAWGLEMCTDSSRLDAQAGVEMMNQCAWALLSRVELVHNAGIVAAGKLCAAAGAVLADDIIAYARATFTPHPPDDAQLAEAVTLIDELGPMGEYVSHPHTLTRFREMWYPQLFDRTMADPISRQAGPDLVDRLNTRARHLIETHVPAPLSDAQLAELDRLEASWHRRQGDAA